MKRIHYREINFDRELNYGLSSYNRKVGWWWYQQSQNHAHQYAYRRVARLARQLFKKEPEIIIDYACGPGVLLTRLCLEFPTARLIALDGSPFMLNAAYHRVKRLGREALRRVHLIEAYLPDFSLPPWNANLLIYAFPNIVATVDDQPYYDKHGYRNARDVAAARCLAQPHPESNTQEDSELIFDALMTARVITRNLRALLKPGGLCIRVEYANAPRTELSLLTQLRYAFEEGSFCPIPQGKKPQQWFKLLSSTYYRSSVMEDVYHQTRDETDRSGGYQINLLKAL